MWVMYSETLDMDIMNGNYYYIVKNFDSKKFGK